MKIRLIKIGKMTLPLRELVDTYGKRLQAFGKVEQVYLKGPEQLEKLMGERRSGGQVFYLLLDERGQSFSSPGFANFLAAKLANPAIKELSIVVGGPYGLGESLRQKADLLWSLSEAVFPSDLAWAIVCEQLYRAFNIIQGTPYHHE